MQKYISKFSLPQILDIEHSDRQFLALKNARGKISKPTPTLPSQGGSLIQVDKELFLFLILQNALVSYQIAGSGELWRAEFAAKILVDWKILRSLYVANKSNIDRWYKFLTSSKYNKRIYNLKIGRLKRFEKFFRGKSSILKDTSSFLKEDKIMMKEYYHDMEKLLEDISKIMGNSPISKTMVFAVKMFGYGARIVFGKLITYPLSIPIPVDSRIRKISKLSKIGKLGKKLTDKEIQKYFQKLAEKFKIPPLHLDSLLRVKR